MQYGVISNYNKENKMCNFCIISDDGNYNIIGYKICSEDEVILAARNLGLKLLNFSMLLSIIGAVNLARLLPNPSGLLIDKCDAAFNPEASDVTNIKDSI